MSRSINEIDLNDGDVFPVKQILSLAICRLAEPIAFTSVMSYTYVMVEDLGGNENTSVFAGLIVSAFAVAEASTAVFWGTLSDRVGRKPIIFVGLTGTALSCLLLGFAKSYRVAFAARLVGGLLNGNIAVIQTMVSEVVKNPKHEPIAYAMHPFTWNLGSILGSALGGYAAQPAKFYPGLFTQDGIFGEYPYLLPNLICFVMMIIIIVQAVLVLEETRTSSPQSHGHRDIAAAKHVDEQTPLQPQQQYVYVSELEDRGQRSMNFLAGSLPSPLEPSLDTRRSSFETILPVKLDPAVRTDEVIADDDNDDDEVSTILSKGKVLNKDTVMWIISILLMCYHVLSFISVVPIYVLDTPHRFQGLDLVGGLGLTVHDVGNYLAINSIWSLFVQIVIFPGLMARFGIWKCIVWATILCPITDIVTPFVTLVPYPGAALCVIFAIRMFFYIIVYPGQLILLTHSVKNTKDLGKINGLAASAASFGRTIAPPLVGVIYDKLGSAAAWWSCGIFATLGIVQLAFIPRPPGKEREIVRRVSIDSV